MSLLCISLFRNIFQFQLSESQKIIRLQNTIETVRLQRTKYHTGTGTALHCITVSTLNTVGDDEQALFLHE